jgi:tetratricopeptide (TPR) repeat protein
MNRLHIVVDTLRITLIDSLAELLVFLKRYDSAASLYNKALPTAGDLAPLLFIGLGHVYERARQPEQAKNSYGQALTLKAGWPLPHMMLGHLAEQEGNREAAAAHYSAALALDDGYSPAYRAELERQVTSLRSKQEGPMQ